MSRYLRQILVRDFGGTAQARLSKAHVALIGLGGIGAPAALYLTAAGVGKITIFEDDVVALHNLHRQILYNEASIGAAKVEIGIQTLTSLNSEIEILAAGRFDKNITTGRFDLILDGSDQLATRHQVNRFARVNAIPLLAASLAQWEGQIAHFDQSSACFACLYPENLDATALPACVEAGVIGPVAGVIGTMAALESIKIISQVEALPAGEMLLFDGAYREIRNLKIKPRAGCPICGQ